MNNLNNINIQSRIISTNDWAELYNSMSDFNNIDIQYDIVNTNDWAELYNNINSLYDINSNLITEEQLNPINNIDNIIYDSDSSLETLDSHSDLDSNSDLLESIDENMFDDINEEIFTNRTENRFNDRDNNVSDNRNEEILYQTFEDYNNENKEIDTKIVNETINKLKFKKNKTICKCIICLENIDKKTQVYKLKCKHNFHKTCLKNWLKQKLECPVCRKEI